MRIEVHGVTCHLVESFLDHYGYLALALGTFFEGETALLVASSLAPSGLFAVPYTVFFGFMGSFISDWVYYLVGRWNGKYFIARRPALQARLEPVRSFFVKHQLQILFTYRFLYGFRIIIPVIIGMSHISPGRYLIYTIFTGLLWASTVTAIGYSAGLFLNWPVTMFEQNLVYIVPGFAVFGLLLGYVIKQVTLSRMRKEQEQA
jgi:membrane protein DedA with SNARE-associated domain